MQPNQENRLAVPAGQPAACPCAAPAEKSVEGKTPTPAAKPHPAVTFDRIDGIFALIALVLGYLFLRLVSLFFAGAGIPIFTLCYLLCVILYARVSGRGPARESWGWAAFLFAFSLLFLKGIYGVMVFPALFFLCGAAAYWTLTVFGARVGGRLDGNFLRDLFHALLRVPLCGFGSLPVAAAALAKKETDGQKKSRLVSPATLLGGVLTLLLLPPVLLLLAQADEGFSRALELIFEKIRFSPEFFLRLFFAIPVALYFFGLFSGAKYRLHTGSARQEKKHLLGFAAAAIPTAALLAVYLIFLIAQLPYFFSAFAGLLPEGFTYAEYARRGFFELIAVAAINLGLLLFAKCCTVKKAAGRKLLAGLLCGATLLLLITAARKLALYIGILGLTRLRLWAGWAMVLVAAATLFFLVDEFHPLQLMRLLVLFFCGWFFLLCAVNTEPLTLRYNYNAWKAGQIEEFDLWQGEDFFAAPVLCEILEDADEDWIQKGCTTRIELAVRDLEWKTQREVVGFTVQGVLTLQAADRVASEGLLYQGPLELENEMAEVW